MNRTAILIVNLAILGCCILFMISAEGEDEKRRIVFTFEENKSRVIASIDVDGRNLKSLTSHPSMDNSPASSPNGRYIAFNSWRNGKPQIFIMDVDGKNAKLLIDDSMVSRPTWSPDSNWVALVKREGAKEVTLLAVNINNGERKEIFKTPEALSSLPSWSPDGRKIAIAIIRVVGVRQESDIYTIDVDENLNGKNLRQLTNDPETDDWLSWSPDSKQIVFQSYRDDGGIFIMDHDGANVKQIHKSRFDYSPSWSRDGQKIVFASSLGLGDGIFVMNPDGSDVKKVFEVEGAVRGGRGIYVPSWLEQGWFNIESENKWITTWGKMKNR